MLCSTYFFKEISFLITSVKTYQLWTKTLSNNLNLTDPYLIHFYFSDFLYFYKEKVMGFF